jgi:hypothetical protein
MSILSDNMKALLETVQKEGREQHHNTWLTSYEYYKQELEERCQVDYNDTLDSALIRLFAGMLANRHSIHSPTLFAAFVWGQESEDIETSFAV